MPGLNETTAASRVIDCLIELVNTPGAFDVGAGVPERASFESLYSTDEIDAAGALVSAFVDQRGQAQLDLPPAPVGWLKIDGYHIRGLQGAGTFAIALDAVEEKTGDPVVLKVYNQSLSAADSVDPFSRIRPFYERERDALKALRGKGVVADLMKRQPNLDHWCRPVFALERGSATLRDELNRAPRRPAREAARLVFFLARTVRRMHQLGWCHGDIKPENIVITSSGWKLIDLGSAAEIGPDAPRTADVTPTIGYAAPEILRSLNEQKEWVVNSRSDLFSVAAIAYELLLGRSPFELTGCSSADTELVLDAIKTGSVDPVTPDSLRVPHTEISDDLSGMLKWINHTLSEPPIKRKDVLNLVLSAGTYGSGMTREKVSDFVDGEPSSDMYDGPAYITVTGRARPLVADAGRPEGHGYALLSRETVLRGREAEVSQLTDWCFGANSPPVMSLIALGGVGKSILTWMWLDSIKSRLASEGIARPIFVSCYEHRQRSLATLVHQIFAAEANPSKPGADELKGELPSRVRQSDIDRALEIASSQPMLIILDGIERNMRAYRHFNTAQFDEPPDLDNPKPWERRLDTAEGEFLRRFAQECPASRLLLTTRLRPSDLEVSDEHENWRDGSDGIDLRGINAAGAKALWRDVTLQRPPGDTLSRINNAVGGHGLTISLLARWYRSEPSESSRRRLKRLADRLPEDDYRIARAEVIWFSIRDLTQEEKCTRLLERLWQSTEPMDNDTLCADVKKDMGLGGSRDVQAALAKLERRGVVGRSDIGGLDVHPVIRQLVFQRLTSEISWENASAENIRSGVSPTPSPVRGPGYAIRKCRSLMANEEYDEAWSHIRDQLWPRFGQLRLGDQPVLLELVHELCRHEDREAIPALSWTGAQSGALNRLTSLLVEGAYDANRVERLVELLAAGSGDWAMEGLSSLKNWREMYAGVSDSVLGSLIDRAERSFNGGDGALDSAIMIGMTLAIAGDPNCEMERIAGRLESVRAGLTRWARQSIAEGLAYRGLADDALRWLQEIDDAPGAQTPRQVLWERITPPIAIVMASRPVTPGEFRESSDALYEVEADSAIDTYPIVRCMALSMHARLMLRELPDSVGMSLRQRTDSADTLLGRYWDLPEHDMFQLPFILAATAQAKINEARRARLP